VGACQEVRMWVTSNVVVPVTKVVTEARETCREIGQWVEEKVTRRIESLVSKIEKVCRDLPWPLSWLCSAVTVVVKVVTWVVETLVKWVVTIVCQVVTFVIGFIVELVVKLVAWLVQFVVCLVTDPLDALKSIYDLWGILLDAVDSVLTFVGTLFDDLIGILDDVDRLLDSLAESLGWLGVIIGLVKALVNFVRRIVEIARDLVKAIKDLALGILSLNPCRMLRGLADLVAGIVRVGIELGAGGIGFAIGGPLGALIGLGIRGIGLAVGGVRDTVQLKRVEEVIEEKIRAAFANDDARIARSLEAVNLNTRIAGLEFRADARRMYLSSRAPVPDLRALHRAGTINLHALAGYLAGCSKGFNEVEAEVVYAGTNVRVTYVDLDTYMSAGPAAVPEFHVFPLSRDKFRDYLEIGRKKARFIGVQLTYRSVTDFEIHQDNWIPLQAGEGDDTVQQEIFRVDLGRQGAITDPLATLPSFAHFHYLPEPGKKDLFGLTSWFRPSSRDSRPSGVTFRNLSPSWLFRWVLIHEMGHYLGIDHEPAGGETRGVDEIMFSPSSGSYVTFDMFYEFLLLGGEPRFTFGDIEAAWEWITSDAADALLP
jgi:hypothetical protein